ncbi:MAG: TolC family protein [Synergistaceae bacterium]|nr:TolC family protein [Synergistaceae bacterium]
MRKNLYVFIAILLLSLDTGILFAQDINLNQVNQEPELSGLSIDECLTLALTNHPSLRKSKAATKDMAAQLEAIRARKRLTLELTGSARFSGTYDYWDDKAHNESLALNASKLLYDTGRNRLQQEIQYENLLGSQESERNTRITVAANAKKAYYDLVLKFLNRDVEREKVKNLEEHLTHAQGLYDVGQSPYIDVTKAQTDLATAKVSLMKAENDILVSQENLRVAMGTDIKGVFNVALSTQLLLPQPAQDFDTLVNIALNDRPDYQKMLHDVKGSELSVKNAARTSSPTITGSAGSSVSKREGSRASNEYSVGISINIPVIDGGAEKAAIDSAKAQLEEINADLDSLRQQITASVRSAALTLINATDRVKSSQTSVDYSEENLTLAQGRYEVGVGAPLELSDAVVSLANARLAYYQALYDAQTARADLDLALGHMPPELSVIQE